MAEFRAQASVPARWRIVFAAALVLAFLCGGLLLSRKDAVPHTFPLAGTRPRCLTTTAETPEGEAVRRVQYPACGVQFHPGSILVPDGRTIPGNPIDLS